MDAFAAAPRYKLFSPGAVAWATGLGGPLAGCVLLAWNYWKLGNNGPAWVALLVGLPAFVLLLALASALMGFVPLVLWPLALGLLAFWLARELQGPSVAKHRDAKGVIYSILPGILAGMTAFISLTGAYLVALAVSGINLPAFMEMQQSVSLGNGEEVYYSRGATRDTANQVAQALKKDGFFDGRNAARAWITGTGDDRAIAFPVGQNAWDDPAVIDQLKKIALDVAPVMGGKPITLRVLDDKLVERKKLRLE